MSAAKIRFPLTLGEVLSFIRGLEPREGARLGAAALGLLETLRRALLFATTTAPAGELVDDFEVELELTTAQAEALLEELRRRQRAPAKASLGAGVQRYALALRPPEELRAVTGWCYGLDVFDADGSCAGTPLYRAYSPAPTSPTGRRCRTLCARHAARFAQEFGLELPAAPAEAEL